MAMLRQSSNCGVQFVSLFRCCYSHSTGGLRMRRLTLLLCPLLVCLTVALQAQAPVRYGSNPAAGNTFTHDGINLYYEIYGSGEPILLIHGNGSSIASFKAQIEYFRQHYKVIAMDSRDQGRSGDS